MATVGHQDGTSELVQERAVRFGVSDINLNTREVHLKRRFKCSLSTLICPSCSATKFGISQGLFILIRRRTPNGNSRDIEGSLPPSLP